MQAKELAEQAIQLTASAALKADSQVVLARAHHARRELAAAQKLYTAVGLATNGYRRQQLDCPCVIRMLGFSASMLAVLSCADSSDFSSLQHNMQIPSKACLHVYRPGPTS